LRARRKWDTHIPSLVGRDTGWIIIGLNRRHGERLLGGLDACSMFECVGGEQSQQAEEGEEEKAEEEEEKEERSKGGGVQLAAGRQPVSRGAQMANCQLR